MDLEKEVRTFANNKIEDCFINKKYRGELIIDQKILAISNHIYRFTATTSFIIDIFSNENRYDFFLIS